MSKQVIIGKIESLTDRLGELKSESMNRLEELKTSIKLADSFRFKESLSLEEKQLLAVVIYKMDLLAEEAARSDAELKRIGKELDVLAYMLTLAEQ